MQSTLPCTCRVTLRWMRCYGCWGGWGNGFCWLLLLIWIEHKCVSRTWSLSGCVARKSVGPHDTRIQCSRYRIIMVSFELCSTNWAGQECAASLLVGLAYVLLGMRERTRAQNVKESQGSWLEIETLLESDHGGLFIIFSLQFNSCKSSKLINDNEDWAKCKLLQVLNVY